MYLGLRILAGAALTDTAADLKEVQRRLLKRDGVPVFEPVQLTLDMLVAEGERLVREQDLVNSNKLSEEYMKTLKDEMAGRTLIGLQG